MISPEIEAKILRLQGAEKWKIGTIAIQVGVHHSTVRRVLSQAGLTAGQAQVRPSLIDAFVPLIKDTLARYPTLRASRLYEMAKERGYPGGPDHFRSVVARFRPRPPAEAYLRLRTLPGEQAQVDWGHFGKLRIGRAERVLSAFVMVLSSSRMLFLRFFLGQAQSAFLQGHQHAFDFFGGVPRILLYDNLKSVVLERQGDLIRFHPMLLAFAAHYRYEPRPVAAYRGNEKGRVERAIQYIRHAFFAARTFVDLDDLNAQAHAFCMGLSAERLCPEDRSCTVGQSFEQERPRLLPLPTVPFPAHEQVDVHVGKTPYVRFDRNDYSVPHTLVRRTLCVLADKDTVRILSEAKLIATHPRSYDADQQIEDPQHISDLVAHKRNARQHRGQNRLLSAVPAAKALLVQLAARGQNLGSATAALLRLLDHHGSAKMQAAVCEALSRDAAHPRAVQQILTDTEQQHHTTPRLPVTLPDDPRVQDLCVIPHPLAGYDTLTKEPVADDDDILF
jgi:transposase